MGLGTTSGSGAGFARLARVLGVSSLRSSTPRARALISFNVIDSLAVIIGAHLHRPTVIPKDAGVSVMLAEREAPFQPKRSSPCRPHENSRRDDWTEFRGTMAMCIWTRCTNSLPQSDRCRPNADTLAPDTPISWMRCEVSGIRPRTWRNLQNSVASREQLVSLQRLGAADRGKIDAERYEPRLPWLPAEQRKGYTPCLSSGSDAAS